LYFPAPIYQLVHPIVPYTCSGSTPTSCAAGAPYHSFGKVAADVAYDAGVNGGVLGYYDASPALGAGFYIFGGTSAGSPQWAAITAIANQIHHTNGLGDFAPILYLLGGTLAFHDVTVGSNAIEPGYGFLATRGWDAATGVGSPNVGPLVYYL
jgi:subtilase family serine protease